MHTSYLCSTAFNNSAAQFLSSPPVKSSYDLALHSVTCSSYDAKLQTRCYSQITCLFLSHTFVWVRLLSVNSAYVAPTFAFSPIEIHPTSIF